VGSVTGEAPWPCLRCRCAAGHGVTKRLKILRNVREHWDEWEIEKGSQKEFRRLWPGKSPYVLTQSEGDILVGGIASLAELQLVANKVLSALERLAVERR
jgi:hypothetical protein